MSKFFRCLFLAFTLFCFYFFSACSYTPTSYEQYLEIQNENISFFPFHFDTFRIPNHGSLTVIVDLDTGVCYLHCKAGYGESITPLYNPDGSLYIYNGGDIFE